MKSFILRGLIVVSLLGIIVVAGIMFFQNLNAEISTSDHIAATHGEVDFEYLNTQGRLVRVEYNTNFDEYALFVCDKAQLLQQGIEKYLGLLRYAKGLDRRVAAEISAINDIYVEALKGSDGAIQKLKNYHEYYAREDISVPTVNANLKGVNAEFVRQYNNACDKGEALYEKLKEAVFRYSYKDTAKLDFGDIFYDALNKYSYETVNAIDTNMINRRESLSVTKLDYYVAYNNFIKLKQKEIVLSNAGILTNANLIGFVKAYNAVDFRLLITDIKYQSDAQGEMLANINTLKQYFNSVFGVDLGRTVNVD